MNKTRHWGHPGALPAAPLRRQQRFPYRIAALGAAIVALIVAHQIYFASQTRALAIRSALVKAAAAITTLPVAQTSTEVHKTLLRYFPEGDATIDTSRFPTEVDVTYHNIGKRTCLEAKEVTRRIEGKVVIQLDGYELPNSCGDHNLMTWRILP